MGFSPSITSALTFDDVLLVPQKSDCLPADIDITTQLGTHKMGLPVFSAAMDTVSEAEMASKLSELGGISVIHRNMSAASQAEMIKAVKDVTATYQVAAAIGTGDDSVERAKHLIDAGVDIIVIDTAHGHSANVFKQIERIRALTNSPTLCVGNIATASAAQDLINAGADILKVGIGPGSICTTRIVAGVGVPQLTAIMNVAAVAKQHNVGVIADGGIRYSGDIVKALAAGADAVMLGSLLAGTDEAPGEIISTPDGQRYKAYRGMGSLGAMQKGSAERYFQKSTTHKDKLVPEGVEGRVPAKGPVADVIHQLMGGLRAGMGYVGAENIAALQARAEFVQLTAASLRESHPHTLAQMTTAPNYKG